MSGGHLEIQLLPFGGEAYSPAASESVCDLWRKEARTENVLR